MSTRNDPIWLAWQAVNIKNFARGSYFCVRFTAFDPIYLWGALNLAWYNFGKVSDCQISALRFFPKDQMTLNGIIDWTLQLIVAFMLIYPGCVWTIFILIYRNQSNLSPWLSDHFDILEHFWLLARFLIFFFFQKW